MRGAGPGIKPKKRMKVTFWGVRGSIATPIRAQAVNSKIRKILEYASPADVLDEASIDRFLRSLPFSLKETYGGNTTCLELRTATNELVIIDAGTGIRELGNKLLGEGYMDGEGVGTMLFTHSHWDHIQGIPFFVPFYIPGNRFNIHAISEEFEERLRYQHSDRHFPIPFEGMLASRSYIQHQVGEAFKLHSLEVTSRAVRHPGNSYSYRFEEDGRVLIFCTDAEFKVEDMDNIEEYLEYFHEADVLIFDTQYTFEEQLQKIDWGHSSASIATDIALKAGVKKLVLFHHDPSYDDEKLDEVYLRALRYKEMVEGSSVGGSDLDIVMAYEGLEIEV